MGGNTGAPSQEIRELVYDYFASECDIDRNLYWDTEAPDHGAAALEAYRRRGIEAGEHGLLELVMATHAGITVGEDGASHQCIEDIGLMRILPNMTVIVPADGIETEKALRALIQHHGPAYMRLSRMDFPVLFDDSYEFAIGKGTVMKAGSDVTICAAGLMVSQALKAIEQLEADGISAQLINMSTIKPIDRELIVQAAGKTGAVVTAEEHSIIGGLGSAVAEVLSEHCPTPMRRIGVQDRPGTSGSPAELLEHYRLNPSHIISAVQDVLRQK